MTELFTINSQPVPVPDAPVTVTAADVEGEAVRDRSGMLHRTVLRRVRTWAFSYGRIREEDRAYLASLLTLGVFRFSHPEGECLCCCKGFSADYYDATAGVWKNFRFRVEEV